MSQDDHRREWHGARHGIDEWSEGRHDGDVAKPHGVPPAYAHPRYLGDLILAGAPRALPVTQQVEHGPDQSRAEAFEREAAAGMAEFYGWLGFHDRRAEGRRYRNTNWIGQLYGPQEPYPVDPPIDPSRYWSY